MANSVYLITGANKGALRRGRVISFISALKVPSLNSWKSGTFHDVVQPLLSHCDAYLAEPLKTLIPPSLTRLHAPLPSAFS